MTTTEPSVPLADLARAHGVATEYWDWEGRHVIVSAETIEAVLTALHVPCHTPEAVWASLQEVELAPWRRLLPECTITRHGQESSILVHVPHGADVQVWAELENYGGRWDLGQREHNVEPREVDGILRGEAAFTLPANLPLGWHTLWAQSGGEAAVSAPLIVVPERLELPRRVEEHGAAGILTQLYAARSKRSWGIGDLGDLSDIALWTKRRLGLDFVLVNPLHAAEPVPPMEPSPYLPTSRRFVNPIYVRVEDVPEYGYLDAAERSRVLTLTAQARALTQMDTIDRDAVWTLKREALKVLHGSTSSPGRRYAFDAFKEREGQGLVDFATWCAFVTVHGLQGWPADLEDPRSEAVAAERERLSDEVEFVMWLQWIVDEQLSTVQRQAREVGMSVGIMQDLAVGVHPEGADAWGLRHVFAAGVTVGAPPDPYSQLGQDWSQPPWRPDRLAALGYAPFRDMVRAALRHSGALRIDHIIGLFRLWWIPRGHKPTEGTYVRFDHEAMIGILALEAQRAGAVIVGEDLGTVEPWVRDYLRERGILGTSILWFEHYENGLPTQPEDYRRLAFSSVTTHDLPPTAGYLTGEHMDVRERLGLFTRPVAEERAEDAKEREAMLDALRQRGLLGEDESVPRLVEALHRWISWTPSRLVGVSISDLAGDKRTINQPGTDEEYPNWRLPLAGPDRRPVLLDDLFEDPHARMIAQSMHRG